MCTILTLSKAFYQANREAVLQRITDDARTNSDSFCLVLFGTSDLKLHTQKIDTIINVLESEDFDRMFLHCRMATTSYNTLSDSHGWTSQDGWIVMHNGILSHEQSERFRVDSQYIVHLLDSVGVQMTEEYLMKHENYANVILMHPETREYRVIRCHTNSLFSDADGNYSTRAVGSIDIPVTVRTAASYYEIDHVASSYSVTDYSTSYIPSCYKGWQVSESEVKATTNAVDFYDLVLDEQWHENGVPIDLYQVFSKEQLSWYNNILKEYKIA